MDEKRRITLRILVFLNLVIIAGSVVLKIIDPIAVSYTDEIRKADFLNFTLFGPFIMLTTSIWIYRSLRPVRALYEKGGDLTAGQVQELRTVALNLPLKIAIQFGVVVLFYIAFVALVVDAIFFKFYPFYKRFISMGLMWAYTINMTLVVYFFAKRQMLPILRITSGRAEDKGHRASVRTGIVLTALTLSFTIFLFLSVYGYSQSRDAFLHNKEVSIDRIFSDIRNRLPDLKDVRELDSYLREIQSGIKLFIIDSAGNYLSERPLEISENIDIKAIMRMRAEKKTSIYEVASATVVLLPLEERFSGLYVGAAHSLDAAEKKRLNNIIIFFLVIGGFFVIFGGIVGYYIANDTAMSIKDIEKGMKSIAEKKEALYNEIEVISLDEVGDLTRSFNNLQKTVRSYHQELDDANNKIVEMERRRAREALDKSEERYRLLAENVTDVIWTVDMNLRYTYVSPSVTQFLGYTAEETLALTPDRIFSPPSFDIAMKAFAEEMAMEAMGGDPSRSRIMEFEHVRKDGSTVWAEVRMVFLRDSEGRAVGLLGVTREVTERKRLEEQLRHSQKLEAVGTLTGGIAHDFNNILTTIMNCGSILEMKTDKNSPLSHYIEQILSSSERAASLVHSLLSFSRKQVMELKPIKLNDTIERTGKFLSRLIGEDIDIKINLAGEELVVLADSGQIEQVLMNLFTNARDAMPTAGALNIETGIIELDDSFLKAHGFGKPGRYALISVSDSGTGMDGNTSKRIFEPFFTTKEVGKGTGLGLSIVYGIVKQHNGYITVYSEPGKGSTFKIYLPLSDSKIEIMEASRYVSPLGGTETVLLAEDEDEVRGVTKSVLEEAGYKVIAAIDGHDAVDKFIEDRDNIHLLIFDVIMPRKNGRDAYEAIREIRPDVKVLFTSGYTADIINRHGLIEDGINFIPKPAPPTELLRKIRDVLDG